MIIYDQKGKLYKKIRDFYDSDLIKIITGIRRCEKSVILNQVIDEVKQKSKNIIYLNFEDKKTIGNIDSADKLINYVSSNRRKGMYYIFLDEVQEVDKWYEAYEALRLDDKAYRREFRPFSLLDNIYKKILITNDDIDYYTSTANHIKLKDFLELNSLDEI